MKDFEIPFRGGTSLPRINNRYLCGFFSVHCRMADSPDWWLWVQPVHSVASAVFLRDAAKTGDKLAKGGPTLVARVPVPKAILFPL
jgi:hypothetical protein